MPRKKSRVTLLPADQDQAKFLTRLIAHHRQLVAQAESSLHQMLSTRYGVDLAREHWALNIDNGVLTREPTTVPPPPNPPTPPR